MRILAQECEISIEDEAPDRLREAWLLMHQAPADMHAMWPKLPDMQAFEAMLRAEAHESAALALVGPEIGFLLSRGGNGEALASIVLPGASNDHTVSGATPALALITALGLALGGDVGLAAAHRSPGQSAVGRLN